jgi:hypothetical protein
LAVRGDSRDRSSRRRSACRPAAARDRRLVKFRLELRFDF